MSIGLAFLAGLASFLSPCVLPLVPSYVTFITGMTVDELTEGTRDSARRHAMLHAALFVLGFSLVFMALGATATVLGATLRRALPLVQQIGGIAIVLFGLYMLGALRLPWLMRERRLHLASKPAGKAGTVLVGVAFGAGWTPCVGPVLASILLYAGMKATMAKGMLLLGAYALGLGVPFFVAAVGLNWYLAGAHRLKRWLRPIEITAGALLVVAGVLLFTGRFTILSNFFAGFGQFVNLEL
ncbi:MAG TPA: cytochrome c biogenesis protein CcdA [Gemmatimonadaceae bacterium]